MMSDIRTLADDTLICPLFMASSIMAPHPTTDGKLACIGRACAWWVTYRCEHSTIGHCAVAQIGFDAADRAEQRDR